ncbi:BA75_03285T0 [Komagataella pastoris]|uniref:BA75_03285T0 n=1 Tax=Komagataella pastoris TaxID=4922 RepID=A0A1B2JCT9_PICPA|nr:BA75_03285T0 [Komagataella pastoris]
MPFDLTNRRLTLSKLYYHELFMNLFFILFFFFSFYGVLFQTEFFIRTCEKKPVVPTISLYSVAISKYEAHPLWHNLVYGSASILGGKAVSSKFKPLSRLDTSPTSSRIISKSKPHLIWVHNRHKSNKYV